MSIIFYDHLIVIKGLDKKIKKHSSSNEEMQELWLYIEEILHHKILGCCLDNLPEVHHKEFLDKFHKKPHDKSLISYLNEKIDKNIEKIIKLEIKKLSKELFFLGTNKM